MRRSTWTTDERDRRPGPARCPRRAKAGHRGCSTRCTTAACSPTAVPPVASSARGVGSTTPTATTRFTTASPHGAGLLAAVPLRRSGQIRLDDDRSNGRDALQRRPASHASRPRCCADRSETVDFGPTTRVRRTRRWCCTAGPQSDGERRGRKSRSGCGPIFAPQPRRKRSGRSRPHGNRRSTSRADEIIKGPDFTARR